MKAEFELIIETYKKKWDEKEKELEGIKKQAPTQKAIEFMKLDIATEIERVQKQKFDMSEKVFDWILNWFNPRLKSLGMR